MSIKLNPRSVVNVPKDADVNLDRDDDQCDQVIEKRQKRQKLKSPKFQLSAMLLFDSINLND